MARHSLFTPVVSGKPILSTVLRFCAGFLIGALIALSGCNSIQGIARDISLASAGVAEAMQPYADVQQARVEKGGE